MMPVEIKHDVKHLVFGYGDLAIHDVHDAETGNTIGLSIGSTETLCEPREIGARSREWAGKDITQVPTEIVLQFDKMESIDVMIEMLQQVKAEMMHVARSTESKCRKHVWFEHKDRCPEVGNCLYCDGGIHECVVCGLAEGQLTAECPGYKANAQLADLVYGNEADFMDGIWWIEVGKEVTDQPELFQAVPVLFEDSEVRGIR